MTNSTSPDLPRPVNELPPFWRRRVVFSIGVLAVLITVGVYAIRLAGLRLADARDETVKVVVRVGSPLPEVSLFELVNQDARELIGVALDNGRFTGLPGKARADFLDLFLFNADDRCILKTRVTSADWASTWHSRPALIAATRIGRKLSRAERDAFFDRLPANLEEHILVVK